MLGAGSLQLACGTAICAFLSTTHLIPTSSVSLLVPIKRVGPSGGFHLEPDEGLTSHNPQNPPFIVDTPLW
jgi:hypothetical protein